MSSQWVRQEAPPATVCVVSFWVSCAAWGLFPPFAFCMISKHIHVHICVRKILCWCWSKNARRNNKKGENAWCGDEWLCNGLQAGPEHSSPPSTRAIGYCLCRGAVGLPGGAYAADDARWQYSKVWNRAALHLICIATPGGFFSSF